MAARKRDTSREATQDATTEPIDDHPKADRTAFEPDPQATESSYARIHRPVRQHGPQSPMKQAPTGPDRLRSVLGVSANVDIDQLCHDAASEIADLLSELWLIHNLTGQSGTLTVKRYKNYSKYALDDSV